MSGNVSAQTNSTIAAILANPPTLSDEEQLFQEALEEVKNDKLQSGTPPLFFVDLVTARDVNETRHLIETKLTANGIWREQTTGTKLHKLEKLSAAILQYKGLFDALAAISA